MEPFETLGGLLHNHYHYSHVTKNGWLSKAIKFIAALRAASSQWVNSAHHVGSGEDWAA
jgi:hypothetical protein